MESVAFSIFLVAGLSIPLALVLRMVFSAIRNQRVIIFLMVLTLLISCMSIWFVDVNIPLGESHIRASGAQASVLVALLAWFAKLSFFAAAIFGTQALRKSNPKKK